MSRPDSSDIIRSSCVKTASGSISVNTELVTATVWYILVAQLTWFVFCLIFICSKTISQARRWFWTMPSVHCRSSGTGLLTEVTQEEEGGGDETKWDVRASKLSVEGRQNKYDVSSVNCFTFYIHHGVWKDFHRGYTCASSLIAPPAGLLSPPFSRCILGIETSVKTKHWLISRSQACRRRREFQKME